MNHDLSRARSDLMTIATVKKKQVSFPFIAVLLCLIASTAPTSAQMNVIGYYASWHSTLLPYDKIHYADLTHINVAFAYPNANGTMSYAAGIPFLQLVQTAHVEGTKVLISLGGAGGSTHFSAATADSVIRNTLITHIVGFLQTNDYDGVDVDWETPANATETGQLTLFIQEMRAKFDQVHPSWHITMAVPPTNWGGQHFDYLNLVSSVDWFNVMCYDFYGSWSGFAGHNSPLHQSTADPTQAGADSTAIVYMVSRGVPKTKLVLGIPFYGVQFNAGGLYQPLTNSTTSNPFYSDVVSHLSSGWAYHWDDISKVPYILNGDSTQFVTFEDTISIRLKVEFAMRQQLGGLMCWELAHDVMADGSQPLLEVMAKASRGVTRIEEEPIARTGYVFHDTFPNPFNPTSIVRFDLPVRSWVRLSILNLLGETITSAELGTLATGRHQHVVDLSGRPSGVYVCRIWIEGSNGQSLTLAKKMVLLK